MRSQFLWFSPYRQCLFFFLFYLLSPLACWSDPAPGRVLRGTAEDTGIHVHFVALGFVVQVPAEEGEKVIHLRLEELPQHVSHSSFPMYHRVGGVAAGAATYLPLLRLLHCLGELSESIAHLRSCDVGRGVLESLESIQS